jgi:predicted house-cleaning noncanonical NTP pyrophosphatase (MazG superfamily)
MSTDHTREALDSTLQNVRTLEEIAETYENQTREELMDLAVELAEEIQDSPEIFTNEEKAEQWREIDNLRSAYAWMQDYLPDHDNHTSYAESYLRDVLEIEIQGKLDTDTGRWSPTLVEVLISFGGPNVWITGPHGIHDDYVEVIANYGETQTARTYAPHLAAHLAGLLECYTEMHA